MQFLEVPILVATGRNVPMNPPQTPDYTNISQVVDMISTDPCSDFPSNMLALHAATGKLVNDIPLICGGQENSNFGTYGSECFKYDASLNEWRNVTVMGINRFRAASAILNGNLWITGGLSKDGNGDINSVDTTGRLI